MAVSSPLMETSINGARGVLINISGSEDMTLEDVESAANLVQEAAHPEANIIFGASFDPELQDEIRVTVIATGFAEPTASSSASDPFEKNAKSFAKSSQSMPVFQQKEQETPIIPVMPGQSSEEETEEEQPAAPGGDDPFDSIFKIFNNK